MFDHDDTDHGALDALRKVVDAQVRLNQDVIEMACLRALMTGDRGVLVATRSDGTVEAAVTARVPYGQVHYLPMRMRS